MLLPVAQFVYNAISQKGISMLPFKANYKYNPVTLLTPKQAKKSSKIAKERIEKLITLHKKLCKLAKLMQEKMKKYYNKKKSEGPDFKEGDKI